MSASYYDDTIEQCRNVLRYCAVAEQANHLASFYAISIQANATLQHLLNQSKELDYIYRTGDRLVYIIPKPCP